MLVYIFPIPFPPSGTKLQYEVISQNCHCSLLAYDSSASTVLLFTDDVWTDIQLAVIKAVIAAHVPDPPVVPTPLPYVVNVLRNLNAADQLTAILTAVASEIVSVPAVAAMLNIAGTTGQATALPVREIQTGPAIRGAPWYEGRQGGKGGSGEQGFSP